MTMTITVEGLLATQPIHVVMLHMGLRYRKNVPKPVEYVVSMKGKTHQNNNIDKITLY